MSKSVEVEVEPWQPNKHVLLQNMHELVRNVYMPTAAPSWGFATKIESQVIYISSQY